MEKNNTISLRIASFCFALTIVLPLFFQFTHLFEEHEHIACDEVTTHLHEKEFDCSLYEFQLNPNYLDANRDISLSITPSITTLENTIPVFHTIDGFHNYFLRGPPMFQHYC